MTKWASLILGWLENVHCYNSGKRVKQYVLSFYKNTRKPVVTGSKLVVLFENNIQTDRNNSLNYK